MASKAGDSLAEAVRAAIRRDTRIRVLDHLTVAAEDGAVTIQGEVADVASKKLALEASVAVAGVDGIVDRLRVRPAVNMDDEAVRRHVGDALMQEPALAGVRLVALVGGGQHIIREMPDAAHEIVVAVEGQVVTLDGDVLSLAHKRLAGVLAWWVPGVCDVINGLGVTADEPESDAETTDAVRAVLEKDPFVNASQIRVFTVQAHVRLDGVVPTEAERHMAECDAWYVFGVDAVENHIEVRPIRTG